MSLKLNEGTFWRFLAADDPTVDIYIIRDIDSAVGERDRQAADERLESGKNFHVVRDHWFHKREMMGGLWGGRKRIAGMAEAFIRGSSAGQSFLKEVHAGQFFLRTHIYPKIRGELCVHSSYARYLFERALPGPPYCDEEAHMGYEEKDKELRGKAERYLAAHQRKSCARKQLDIVHRLPVHFTYLFPRYKSFSFLLAHLLRAPFSPIAVIARLADYCLVRWRFCPKSRS